MKTDNLQKDLISNANYIGEIKNMTIEDTTLFEKDEEAMLMVTQLPFRVICVFNGCFDGFTGVYVCNVTPVFASLRSYLICRTLALI